MRLDARNGDVGWFVWDSRRCISPSHVVWCDDVSMQWGGYRTRPDSAALMMSARKPDTLPTHTEAHIVILPQHRLVLFNPVGDDSNEQQQQQRATASYIAARYAQDGRLWWRR